MSKRLFSILSLMIVQLSLGMLFAQEAFEMTENFKRVGSDNMAYSIASNDVANTGIASAYSSHSFYITPSSADFSKCSWSLVLTLADGSSVVDCVSNEQTFTIPQISDTEKYEHSVEGEICGTIKFNGVINSKNIELSYPLRLDLKPRILSAKVLSTKTNSENSNYYDAVVEIKYEGSNYVHAYVEEDYSPLLKYYYSSTPYYTKMELTDIASWCDAWFNITVRNDYGSDNYVLKLSHNNGAVDSVDKLYETSVLNEDVCIYVYGVNGKCLGIYNKDKNSLPKGIYFLRYYNKNNTCIRKVKLCIK